MPRLGFEPPTSSTPHRLPINFAKKTAEDQNSNKFLPALSANRALQALYRVLFVYIWICGYIISAV